MSSTLTETPSASITNESPPDFAELFAAERRHFWFRARNQLLSEVVRQLVAGLADGYRLLEVGCGTGNVLRALEQVCVRGNVIGLDLHPQGLQLARQSIDCPLVAADIHQLPFSEPFQVIGMFDVLEHLPDDRRVLDDLRKALAADGRLVLTVPAHTWLWSEVDVYSGHFRRYAPRQLALVLGESGFRLRYLTQFMGPLVPLMWLRRCAKASRRPTSANRAVVDRRWVLEELRVMPILNELLAAILTIERPLIRWGLRLPLGTSLLAIASPA